MGVCLICLAWAALKGRLLAPSLFAPICSPPCLFAPICSPPLCSPPFCLPPSVRPPLFAPICSPLLCSPPVCSPPSVRSHLFAPICPLSSVRPHLFGPSPAPSCLRPHHLALASSPCLPVRVARTSSASRSKSPASFLIDGRDMKVHICRRSYAPPHKRISAVPGSASPCARWG